jgi:hypothetical protein
VGAGGPLLPAPPRPPASHHLRAQLLAAILDMARTSTPWRLLPARELGLRLAGDLLAPAAAWEESSTRLGRYRA